MYRQHVSAGLNSENDPLVFSTIPPIAQTKPASSRAIGVTATVSVLPFLISFR